MKIKRILCPVDFSESNASVNQYASMLAQSTNASITYFHAFLPDTAYGAPEYFDSELEEKRLLKELEEKFTPTIKGIESSHVVEFGSPSDQIVIYAKENDIDMIVLGTHGRTGLLRVLMGSVAESVVRHAECPVLAIKPNSVVTQEA